jgi:nucleotide-binding universal stress UspA family protein
MNTIKTILVPFDFSDISKKALDYAIDFIGMDNDTKILLAHITENEDTSTLEEAFKEIKAGKIRFRGAMEWVIQKGTLTETLLDIQKNQTVDLVIMGTSGEDGKHMLKVNNTSKLAVEIDNCSVIAIPDKELEFSIKKIALVLGKDKIEDRSVLETLLRITRRFNAKVVVLTVQNEEGIYGYSENDESNENLLEYYLEGFYSHHAFIENPDIVAGIDDYVTKNEIDMIAVMPLNHAAGNKRSKGLLTKELTMSSKVPVLVID